MFDRRSFMYQAMGVGIDQIKIKIKSNQIAKAVAPERPCAHFRLFTWPTAYKGYIQTYRLTKVTVHQRNHIMSYSITNSSDSQGSGKLGLTNSCCRRPESAVCWKFWLFWLINWVSCLLSLVAFVSYDTWVTWQSLHLHLHLHLLSYHTVLVGVL